MHTPTALGVLIAGLSAALLASCSSSEAVDTTTTARPDDACATPLLLDHERGPWHDPNEDGDAGSHAEPDAIPESPVGRTTSTEAAPTVAPDDKGATVQETEPLLLDHELVVPAIELGETGSVLEWREGLEALQGFEGMLGPSVYIPDLQPWGPYTLDLEGWWQDSEGNWHRLWPYSWFERFWWPRLETDPLLFERSIPGMPQEPAASAVEQLEQLRADLMALLERLQQERDAHERNSREGDAETGDGDAAQERLREALDMLEDAQKRIRELQDRMEQMPEPVDPTDDEPAR